VHLWDQADDPIFWLSDRALVRDMLGDYDSLPARYTAADWVSRQQGEMPPVLAMVTLGDPASASFAELVAGCRLRPLIRSTRMRLVPGLSGHARSGDVLGDRLVQDIFGADRCMLGSDLPIENLRSGFGPLYPAYDAIFRTGSDDDRAWVFHRAAEHWYVSAGS
jgi:hypothetical protein